METAHYLLHGFSVALQPIYLFYCFMGALAGTLVGILPAIGPVTAVALLLPTAFHLDPKGAIIMLAAINYGAMYGGSITSILVNVPGEASSVVTCLDGYQMALQGRAGPALGITAFGSFIAGNLSIVGLMLFAPALGRAALELGPPEYFTLMVMAITMVAYLARGSMIKTLIMGAWGLILSSIGMDMVTSKFRFTFNIMAIQDGINIIPLAIGLLGFREVLYNFQAPVQGELLTKKISGFLPTLRDWKDSIMPILRGSTLGFFMGILPGMSPMVPTFISYGIEKRLSKNPEKFGTGAIEGVAAPESCNNAAICGTQVPLFSLGIPTTTMNTMLLAALMIFGMTPGPQFIKSYPDLFWGLVASMYLGNLMLLVLNLPLIPLWVKVLRIPFDLLNVLILIFCVIGAYSINQQSADIYLLIIFGLVGFLSKKLSYEPAPLILTFILGRMIEKALRQSLILSQGSFSVFVTRPISVVFVGITVFIILTSIFKKRGSAQDAPLKWDRISALLGMAVGIFIIVKSFGLGVGGLHQPGAGFFPLVGGILLTAFSIILLVQSTWVKVKSTATVTQDEGGNPRLAVYAFCAVVVYALVFELLGYILSTFFLVIFLLRIVTPKKWWITVLTSVIISLASYFIFTVLLHSELPEGVLGGFLGPAG